MLLGSKDQAANAIKRFQGGAEAEAGTKLRTLRTDRGGEFTARTFADYCAEEGVQRHLTAPYTPQQNGVVERRNQTVMGTARSMMKGMSLPSWFWGEAVNTAVFTLNRAPTQSVDGKMPYEVWFDTKPPVHFLRTFYCVAHIKATGKYLAKLDDRSTPMVFVGYEPGSKAYRLYNPSTRRVVISRDVVFEEERAWDWGAEKGAGPDDDIEPFQVETIVFQERYGGPTTTPSPPTSTPPPAPTTPVTAAPTPATPMTAPPAPETPVSTVLPGRSRSLKRQRQCKDQRSSSLRHQVASLIWTSTTTMLHSSSGCWTMCSGLPVHLGRLSAFWEKSSCSPSVTNR